MPTVRWSATLAAAGLLAAACANGSGDGGSDGAAAPSPTVTRCASFDDDCQEVLDDATVELRGILFRPATLEVSAGTTVSFVNLDPVDHTVTAGSKGSAMPDRFDVTLDVEESTELTFDEPGEIRYFCRIHSGMTGTIEVTEKMVIYDPI